MNTNRESQNREARTADVPSRRRFVCCGAASLAGALLPAYAFAQSARITTIDLGGATLFQGAGCNVVALTGIEGVLMIDGGLAANAGALLAAVRSATRTQKIHTLINTHWHPEQVGANAAVAKDGGVILAHEKTAQLLGNTVYQAIGFKTRVPALPKEARPTKTIRSDGTMPFGGLQVDYGYMPAAHTDGDLYIHIPKLNLLVVGGVVSPDSWPLLDHHNGAWLGGRVRALQRLGDLVRQDTRVVSAQGRLMTGQDIFRHRGIYERLFVTMIEYLNKGYGPEDAVTQNPLKEYEKEFGDASEFEYAALRSMMIAYVPD